MTAPIIHRTRHRGNRHPVADVWAPATNVVEVDIDGYGAGWYILATNAGTGEVQVRRHGAEMVVFRSQVRGL